MRLSIDLLEKCDRAIQDRGLTKREFFERALRRELEAEVGDTTADGQEELDLDVHRKDVA
ncbi:hypothetical protein A5748_16410 [Nocardia sp. 852002-51244_SCH5132740]|nr:hypothetical protein A5748_16410 [Nocardia sp. 852002-51244_SCH5132740]